jgi:hypothetical protein
MLPTEPKVGWLFRYSYLWHWQFEKGREQGDKDRPVLVLAIIAALEDETSVVRVLPVTHSPLADPRHLIEIPPATKKRLGLDDERSSIVLTESNRFAWPGPDIRAVDRDSGYYGPLPPALFDEVRRRFVALARARRHAAPTRSE